MTNYSEIINRIEQNLVAPKSNPNINISASKQIAEASGESDEKEPEFSHRNHIDEDDLEGELNLSDDEGEARRG